MAPAISMRGAGVQFRMWRRNRARRPSPVGQGRRWRLWGLRDITLELGPGELVGVIGPNGAGKTTLMKLAAGIFRPDEGEVTVVGRVAPLLSPLAGLHPRLSGWENIRLSGMLLGLSRRQACAVAPEVAEFSALGRFLDAPARTYSAGMKARLGFAVSIFCDADVLLYDEVLAFGDQEFHDRSSAKLRQLRDEGRTVLLSSHDIASLVDCADRMLWVEAGHLVETGEPAEVAERYLGSRRSAADGSDDLGSG